MMRSNARRAIVGLALLALIFAACDEWPTLGFDPSRAGNNPDTAINTDNVGDLTQQWSASLPDTGAGSSPVVAAGSVFVAAGNLRVFSADGSTGCSGFPRVCTPIWTAKQGGTSTPTYANHVVYTTFGNSLYAFDAAGTTGCSGTPKTCQPLWRATLGGRPGSPVVSGGVLYVGTEQTAPKHDLLYAFDAEGVDGCTGSPKICAPLWRSTGDAGATPTVAGGLVYATTTNETTNAFVTTLTAYDAAGSAGCSGSPKRCRPVWRYRADDVCSGSCGLVGPPSVAGGKVYVLSTTCCEEGMSASALLTFDAAGQDGCTGADPRVCQPLRTTSVVDDISFARPPVAAANGVLFPADDVLSAMDASTGAVLWRANTTLSSASIAGGVVYIDAWANGEVAPRAYDAAGVQGCSGSPKVCDPLWSGAGVASDLVDAAFADWSPPVVAGGTVYARVGDLRAYRPPPR
jgi:hypothetical protein